MKNAKESEENMRTNTRMYGRSTFT